jgi:succinylarginine dihydrolase
MAAAQPACACAFPLTAGGTEAAFPAGLMLDESRITILEDWVDRHYRDRLLPGDLGDPR